MKSEKTFKVNKIGEKFIVSLNVANKDNWYTTYQEVAQHTTIWHTDVLEIMEKLGGSLMKIESPRFTNFGEEKKEEVFEVIAFDLEEDAKKMIDVLGFEKKVSEVFRVVKKLEREYGSEYNRTKDNIRECYYDEYILDIWEYEKYSEETGEGFMLFEDFLIDFIETNLIFE